MNTNVLENTRKE